MNLRNLIVVIVRLFSLDVLLNVAMTVPTYLLSVPVRMEGYSTLLPGIWLCIFGFVVGIILLWIFAPYIADLVARGMPSSELSFGALSLSDCYSSAFLGVGLYQMVVHLAPCLFWALSLFKEAASTPGDSWRLGVSGYTIWSAFLPFLFGLVLFVNSRKWAVALARRQTETPPSDGVASPGPGAN